MSHEVWLDEISFLEKTCRACSRYDPNDSMTFHAIFNGGPTGEPTAELAGVLEEFLLWNLDIKLKDGLPQQMCSECVERFVQVKNFREEVLDTQRLLSSYRRGGTNDPEKEGAIIQIEALQIPPEGIDHVGYISPSKLIEYVGYDDENEEGNDPCLAKNTNEIDYFEQNESDFLFNHPNQIEESEIRKFKPESPKATEFKSSCNMNFDDNALVIENKVEEPKSSDGGNAKCDICLKGFRSALHVLRHKRQFHVRADFQCPNCGAEFKKITQRTFDYHLRTHHAKRYKCSYCDKSFHQKVHMVNHQRTHTNEKPFVCGICGKSFRQQYNLQEHLVLHKNAHPYKCEICGKGFSHRNSIRMHVRLHTDFRPHQCEICGKTFIQKAHFDLHSMKHSGIKPFKCEFCLKTFRLASQLGNHMQSVHFSKLDKIRDGIYKCSQCNLEFSNGMDLIQHKKSHDNGERKFLCPHCGAGFKRETTLNHHVDAVHLKKKPYSCIYCNKTFAQLSNLSEHLETHKGSKQYKCSFCDKSFTLKKTKVMHEAIHTGEKRFKCNFCDESFVYRQTLGTHIMNHFRDDNEEEYEIKEDNIADDDFFNYDSQDLGDQDEFGLDVCKQLMEVENI